MARLTLAITCSLTGAGLWADSMPKAISWKLPDSVVQNPRQSGFSFSCEHSPMFNFRTYRTLRIFGFGIVRAYKWG